MEKTHNPSPDYVKGFNQGYTVADVIKDFAPKIQGQVKENSRLHGMIDGAKQRGKERYLEKLRSNTPKPDNTPKPSKGMDR